MIVDSSALVAIIYDEQDAADLARLIESAEEVAVSAATVVETSMVLGPRLQGVLDQLLAEANAVIVPVDAAQVAVARRAAVRFGKGSGSPAKLNFGDCFSYALASVMGRPLLCKGDDFVHTDLELVT